MNQMRSSSYTIAFGLCLTGLLLSGCSNSEPAETTETETKVEETSNLNQTIDGSGIQLVKLQLPGMT